MLEYKIYKATCLVNGKKYFGQTREKDPNTRFQGHKTEAKCGTDTRFYRAIRKYGFENFEFVVVQEWDTAEEANRAERWWIKEFRTQDPSTGYNTDVGGTYFGITPESRERIFAGQKKRLENNPELLEVLRRNMRPKNRLGIKHTEETRQRMRERVQAGWDNGTRKKPRKRGPQPRRGPMSEENKNKISEALKKAHATNPTAWANSGRKPRKKEPIAA